VHGVEGVVVISRTPSRSPSRIDLN
jgi:hypothetical protein